MATPNTIQEIYFCKIPFDNTYKNVPYFEYTSTSQIANYYKTYFTGFKWKIPTLNISLRETNGKTILNYGYGTDTDLTLQGRIIKDYNYCILGYKLPTSENLTYIFYFITGYTTLNQGMHPSTELQLQYDVWTNNFASIYNNSVKFPLTKATLNTYFTYNNNKYIDNNFSCKQVQTIFKINPYTKNPSPSNPDPLLAEPKLLWLKVTLDTQSHACIKNDGDEAWTSAENVGVLASAAQLPVIYVPIAVLTPDGLDFESDIYTIKGFYNRSIQNSTTLSNINFKLDGTHIVDAAVTAYPPFIVDYEDYTFTIYNRFNFSQFSYVNGSNYPVSFIDAGDQTKYYAVFSKERDYMINWEQEFTYTTKIYVPQVNRFSGTILTDDEILDSSSSIKSPYNTYLKLDICGTQYSIIPPPKCLYYRIRVKHVESATYIYVAYYNYLDSIISRSPYMRIDEVGRIPVVADSLSVFMRNNGNTYAASSYAIGARGFTNAMNKLAGIGMSVAGSVSGALQLNQALLDTELSQRALNAKIQDVDNQRDNIQPVSNNSIDNIFRNQVIIYQIYAKSDANDTLQLAYDEHYYGVNCNKYAAINEIYKRYFDYKQFASVSIPSIHNIDERKMVEKILTDGTTYWYCDYFAIDEKLDVLNALNKQIGNEVT